MAEPVTKLNQYLMSGVSHVIPFVVSGGLLISAAIALVSWIDPHALGPSGPDFAAHPWLRLIYHIGTAAFKLVVPVIAGYIAFGMADRAGLAPGFIGGIIAADVGAGFLGGIFAGLIAGFIVQLLKKIKVHSSFKPVMPILVIPVISSLIVGVVMYAGIGVPIKNLMTFLNGWLEHLNTGSAALLAVILGAMIAFDMGGPVNKVAFFFGAAMIQQGNYAVMGANAAAICIPPIGLGLATIIGRRLWKEGERESGYAALVMGLIGITEGAIPFAVADPLRVIPTIMIGSIVGSVIAMTGGVGDHAPHGGPIVLPVIDHKLAFIIAILAGALTVAVTINLLRLLTYKKNGQKPHPGQPQHKGAKA